MWKFTEIADAFDEQRKWENEFVDSTLQKWAGTTPYSDSPWYRNTGVWVAAASGTLYSVNKFTTTVAGGFVDVLRLGDGVRSGGWGYGKDALRLLMVLGPALRAARWAWSLAPAVDTFPALGNCSWIAAARLLRFTGVKPFAELSQLAKWEGVAAAETEGAVVTHLNSMLPALRLLGASARAGKSVKSMTELAEQVAQNPRAAIMFAVEWSKGAHVLIAVRGFFGGMVIIDRGGKVVSSLAELEALYPVAYEGIGSAVLAETIVVANSALVASLGELPSLVNVVSQAAGPRPSKMTGQKRNHHHNHAAVTLGAADQKFGTKAGSALTNQSAGEVHRRSDGAKLSTIANKIYHALDSSRTPASYRQIMDRTHLHIDDVIRGVQELADKGKVAVVPLNSR